MLGSSAGSDSKPANPDPVELGGPGYNPDLIVIEADDTHRVVEVEMDKEMESEDVKGKRNAAERWANYVNADDGVDVTLALPAGVRNGHRTAKGSWQALRQLGDK